MTNENVCGQGERCQRKACIQKRAILSRRFRTWHYNAGAQISSLLKADPREGPSASNNMKSIQFCNTNQVRYMDLINLEVDRLSQSTKNSQVEELAEDARMAPGQRGEVPFTLMNIEEIEKEIEEMMEVDLFDDKMEKLERRASPIAEAEGNFEAVWTFFQESHIQQPQVKSTGRGRAAYLNGVE